MYGFSVMLIPHTQGVVYLHEKLIDGHVNIEVDQIGKYVERLLGLAASDKRGAGSGLSMDRLRELGFLS